VAVRVEEHRRRLGDRPRQRPLTASRHRDQPLGLMISCQPCGPLETVSAVVPPLEGVESAGAANDRLTGQASPGRRSSRRSLGVGLRSRIRARPTE
jgi:hypothetical protein